MGVNVTANRSRGKIYFPGLYAEVQGYIKACLACQAKQIGQADQRHTLSSPITGYPFQRIYLDFVGPLNPSKRSGATWILICRDSFSKWIEAIPLPRATTEETVRALDREVFSRFGYPEAIHTDCGRQFTSQFFTDFGRMTGIQITNTGGYNPKGNGQVERVHRDLGNILRALTADQPDSWEDVWPQALFALRTAVCRSTGLTPFQVVFGRDCSTPLDVIFGRPQADAIDSGTRDHHAYLRKHRDAVDKTHRYAREHLAQAVVRQRRQYHQDRKTFHVGMKDRTPSSHW